MAEETHSEGEKPGGKSGGFINNLNRLNNAYRLGRNVGNHLNESDDQTQPTPKKNALDRASNTYNNVNRINNAYKNIKNLKKNIKKLQEDYKKIRLLVSTVLRTASMLSNPGCAIATVFGILIIGLFAMGFTSFSGTEGDWDSPGGNGNSPGLPPPGVPPPTTANSCPIAGGYVSCGTYWTPKNGCGHCDGGYPDSSRRDYCSSAFGGTADYTGTEAGIDIAGSDYQAIYLPQLDGHNIRWTFQYQRLGSTESIQNYSGIDTVTNRTYWISFHHTANGSGNPGTHDSGEAAARICGGGCNENHTHVQLASGGFGSWIDTAQWLCN